MIETQRRREDDRRSGSTFKAGEGREREGGSAVKSFSSSTGTGRELTFCMARTLRKKEGEEVSKVRTLRGKKRRKEGGRDVLGGLDVLVELLLTNLLNLVERNIVGNHESDLKLLHTVTDSNELVKGRGGGGRGERSASTLQRRDDFFQR